jgi:hypothetical protein
LNSPKPSVGQIPWIRQPASFSMASYLRDIPEKNQTSKLLLGSQEIG